jgi:hypothetical protein
VTHACIHCGTTLTFNSPIPPDGTRDAWCEIPSCSSKEETYTATSDGLIHVWDADAREITQQPNGTWGTAPASERMV